MSLLLSLLLAGSHSLAYSNVFGLRVHPAGAMNQFKMVYRYRFFDSDSKLLQPASINIGSITSVTPANVRAGPIIELMPLAVLNLSLSYEAVGYFGNLNMLWSAPDATRDASDSRRSAEEHLRYAAFGNLLAMGALVQVKVGPIALRSSLNVLHAHMRLREGDTVWYDAVSDMVVPGYGFFLVDDTDLLYVSELGLTVGARYTLGHSFANGPQPTQQRVGPVVLWEFFDRHTYAGFNKPSVVLLAQWYLQHRYRTGQEFPQSYPQVIFAFLFQGELALKR